MLTLHHFGVRVFDPDTAMGPVQGFLFAKICKLFFDAKGEDQCQGLGYCLDVHHTQTIAVRHIKGFESRGYLEDLERYL